ncbi:MAG: TIGR02530 family flagellar biosynthesis protein [Candidatus Marinimicrobia bacterium]|nr:TIGR02530 family flagellar biosynthesis protein [Candidatus Neomarinimicrobiota bacterium]
MKLAELQIRQAGLPLRPDQIRGPQGTRESQKSKNVQDGQPSFNDILNQKVAERSKLKFSAHAIKRMDQRDMHPSQIDLERLNEGFEKARAKGAQSSLILVDEMAYVVSVKNETVITALDRDAAQGNVFSNIDSVAIV